MVRFDAARYAKGLLYMVVFVRRLVYLLFEVTPQLVISEDQITFIGTLRAVERHQASIAQLTFCYGIAKSLAGEKELVPVF